MKPNHLATTLFALAYVILAGSAAAQDIGKKQLDNAIHSTVLVCPLLEMSDGSLVAIGHGSGTVLDRRGMILTNAHNLYYTWSELNPDGDPSLPSDDTLRLADAWAIYYAQDPRMMPTLLCYAQARFSGEPGTATDLALLQCIVEERVVPFRCWLELGNSDDLQINSDVFVVGYPDFSPSEAFSSVTFWPGTVTNFLSEGGRVLAVGTSATISPGNSGGAALDARGKLVGVPTFGIQGGGGMHGYFLPVNTAKELFGYELPGGGGVPVGGQIIDGATGQGVINAGVYVLRAGVKCRELFLSSGEFDPQAGEKVFAQAQTYVDGKFWMPGKLPPGTYSMMVLAEGFMPLFQDDRIRIGGREPEIEVRLTLTPITR